MEELKLGVVDCVTNGDEESTKMDDLSVMGIGCSSDDMSNYY